MCRSARIMLSFLAIVLVGGLTLGRLGTAADEATGTPTSGPGAAGATVGPDELGFEEIVFVKRRPYSSDHYYTDIDNGTSPDRFDPRNGIFVFNVRTRAERPVVTAAEMPGGKGFIGKISLSFDAKKVLFDFRENPGAGFRVWEVHLDGTGLRQVSFPPDDEAEKAVRWRPGWHTDDIHPCYLPDGKIIFSSTRAEHTVLCGGSSHLVVPLLHRMEADGTGVEQLSWSPVSEFCPVMLDDGRVMYHRWEYVDKGARVAKTLWAMNPDGTRTQELYGLADDTTTVYMYPQPVPGRSHRLVCVGTCHFPQGGCLGSIMLIDFGMDLRVRGPDPDQPDYVQGDSSYPVVNITPEVFVQRRTEPGWHFLTGDGKYVHDRDGRQGHLFTHPFPISEREFLVSYKVNPSDHYKNVPNAYALYLIDTEGARRFVHADPDLSCWHPTPVVARPVPPILLMCSISCGTGSQKLNRYDGKFCSGKGDIEFLRLIDESFAFFNPNPTVPNLTMLYQPEWNTFVEGARWDAWWIQNSYGFSYSATPFLQEPWFSLLQRSWDLHWDNQGDGKRMSMWGGIPTATPHSPWVAPDGSLGDCARPNEIIFKQGDGDLNVHDWYYEGAAAGVVMQSEILLASRNRKAMEHYLPKMERACDFIENTRDPKNNLFLVGPASDLLAPSYGGVKQPDGTFGKGYLAGLSITYLAALDRMVELYRLTGDKEKLAEYGHRQKITRESLPQLLTPAGYFVKSIETGGIKHGVLGQEQFGYLEGVANADAVALRVADDKTAESIYNQIAAFPEIRPFDFLLTNAPGLDDTYRNWGSAYGPGLSGIHAFGQWVNGGAWGTVEGRAILMYSRLGKFEDIRRSAVRAMKWAKDFRMDAPWSQRGENTHNVWSDNGRRQFRGVAVMVDNFAIPAATIRGLFDYEYRHDRLILRPRVPGSITEYTQKQPVRFGDKKLYLSCRNGGPDVKSVKVNGKAMNVSSPDEVVLFYDELPMKAEIEITTEGGWPEQSPTTAYPVFPSLKTEKDTKAEALADLPESLEKPFAVLTKMKRLLDCVRDADYEIAFVNAAIKSCVDYRVRAAMDPGPGYYRPITPERREGINKFYEQAALSMYRGFVDRMENYAAEGDAGQKHIAELFSEAQK